MLSVSVSQIKAYSSCAKQWEFRRLIRAPYKPNLNRIMGKSMHAGIEVFNEAISTKRAPDSDAVVARFERDFLDNLEDYMVEEEYKKYRKKSTAKSPMTEEKFRDKLEADHLAMGKSLLLQFMSRTDHGTEFKFVEERLEHKLIVAGEEVLFRYVPDIVDKYKGRYRLRDYKTKGKEDDKFAAFQLTGYAFLLKEQFGIDIDIIDQLSFIKAIKKPRIQLITYDMSRLQEDIMIFKEELETFVRGIKAGVFPRNPDHIFCPSCDYRAQCFNPIQQATTNDQSSTQNTQEALPV